MKSRDPIANSPNKKKLVRNHWFWLEIVTWGALLNPLLWDHLWHLELRPPKKNMKHSFNHRESAQNRSATPYSMIFYSKIIFSNIFSRILRHFFHQNHWFLGRKSWKSWKLVIYMCNGEVVGALLPNRFGQTDTRWLSTPRDTLISGIVWQCFFVYKQRWRPQKPREFFVFRVPEHGTG